MLDPENWRELFFRKTESLRGTGVRGLAENFASLAVLQAATYILPLITVPYLVRVLGVELFGLVSFAQAVIQYFIILVDFGFNFSATRDIAANRDNPDKIARIYSGALIVKFVLLALGFVILYFLTQIVSRFGQDPAVFLVTYGLVVGGTLFPVWFFQGMERMKYSTALVLMARVIFVVLIFVLVRTAEDYLLVPALNAAGMIVAGLASLWIVRVRFGVRFTVPPWVELKQQVRDSFQFFVATLSSSVSASFNSLMLGLFTTNEIVGLYAAAEKLFNALYPYMASRQNVRLFRRIFIFALGAAIVLAAGVLVFSADVTRIVFGESFADSAGIVRIFCIIIPVAVTSMMLGYPFLAALGHPSYANYSNAVGSIVHLILVAALIPYITPERIALVLLLTESVITGVKIYGIRKHRLWSVA
jgi:PST family polysaccharide transporter